MQKKVFLLLTLSLFSNAFAMKRHSKYLLARALVHATTKNLYCTATSAQKSKPYFDFMQTLRSDPSKLTTLSGQRIIREMW
jgi:hypothetical protein